jgi:Oxidoreductase family, NAD-binding Rossmann fold
MLSIVLKLAQPLNVKREARIQENLAMSQENNSLASEPNTNLEQTIQRKIKYAVVGLGYISQVAILPAFVHAKENSELVAIVSGDPGKRKALGKKYKVPKTYNYEQYADCLASGIDAVYIALPNSMHRAYAEGVARAGCSCVVRKAHGC